jgi:uncharacterized protein YqgV (UPF0045/DUF77 family)
MIEFCAKIVSDFELYICAMEKTKIVNFGLQLVPLNADASYDLIDEVILHIQSKNYPTTVTPFETVIECTFEQGTDLMNEVNRLLQKDGELVWLLNLRIHVNNAADVYMQDKTTKHQHA